LGATFEGQRFFGGLEKDEKVLGFWRLADDLYGYLVDHLEGKGLADFRGRPYALSRFQALPFRTFYGWSHVLMVVLI